MPASLVTLPICDRVLMQAVEMVEFMSPLVDESEPEDCLRCRLCDLIDKASLRIALSNSSLLCRLGMGRTAFADINNTSDGTSNAVEMK